MSPGSSLYLHSGTYFFQSLDLEPGANLYVDSSHGPVFLYATTTLIFRGNEKALDASVPQLFMGFLGICEVDLEAPFNGVFIAPYAPLLHMEDALWVLDPVKKAAGNNATVYGNSIVVDPGETIKPSNFDWSSVPGFPVPPGGWAANGGTNGTGTPGSGGTSGGTGAGGGKVTTGTLPPSAISFHLSNQPNDPGGAGDPGIPQTTTATITPKAPVPFHLPKSFDVGGVLANGTATVTYTSCTGPVVTCTFQGGSASATPTTVEDLEAGRTATFVSCSDGQPVTALRCGTNFFMSTQPVPGWPVTVDLSLDDRACNTKVDLLTPLQTRQMLDSFHWPDPSKPAPTVAEMAADGKTPNLYYGWVYLHDTKDLLRLRQMYVHILSRPLYNSELEPFAGQCVEFSNPGDGIGAFVPVIIPGQVYNTILNVQNTAFQQRNNIKPGDPLFKAVILRSTTPIDFQQLKQSGFRYLDYEGGPISQSAMQLQGSAVSVVLQDLVTFALKAVVAVQGIVTTALGDLDALFAGRINYNMTLNVGNSGTPFSLPMAIRGWGQLAGQPLGAGGLKVTLLENLYGLIPETFSSHTNDGGFVSIRPASHDPGTIGGAGFCVTLQNDAAWATSFLLPDDVCNLQGFDRLAVGLATDVFTNVVNVPDFSQNQQFQVTMSSPQLSAMYGMTDAFKYSRDVLGYTTATAHALVGSSANTVGSFNNERAFTFALHFRNQSDLDNFNLLSPYINNLGYSTALDQISSGAQGLLLATPLAGPLTLGASFVVSTLANNDIVLPDGSIDDSYPPYTHREVGTHEFGHFILMNLIHDTDSSAIDNIIGDTVGSGKGNDYWYSTRYINEAFADFISGQVTGIANYGWLDASQGANQKLCIANPCFDRNFVASPSGSDSKDTAGIAALRRRWG